MGIGETMNSFIEELKGKRLLILGGSLWKNGIKQFCDEYGITIIAAGNDPTSGICDIANEYYNVNSTDPEVMKKLIREKKIDGVYMGGNEPVIAKACQYIKEMGLPCYCDKKQWDALQNKDQFKELCIQFDLPVVRKFELESVTDCDFPVITKPADGSGSHGFSVCRNREQLKNGYSYAAENSPTATVIIEQFVPNDGIVVIYTVSEGKLLFSTMENKYPAYFEKYGTYVGGLFDFESELIHEFRSLFESKLQKLIEYLGIKEGNFWIEVFHDENNYYFNEVGFRYGGSGSLYPVDYFRHINQVATDVYYALTGKSMIKGFTPLYGKNTPHKKKYAIYPVYLMPGKIKKIKGIDELIEQENVLNILPMKKEGNIIPDNGSFSQVVMLIHFVYDNYDELQDTLKTIHKKISVFDETGNEMVLTLLDINSFVLR